ncbi:hypothetical protein [Halobacterium yunchengense]|uniref:hypothetical protein n=1 Tax=Halobacterium yunchengense TaxID=3108497 RepID=UPI003008BF3A
MQRRKFIAGVGSLAAASAAAMGTGAFTSVSANRSLSVEVADDADALLGLSPSDGSNAAYAEETGGTLEFNFDEDATGVDGDGVNDDARTIIRDVFQITNQGTQDVYVFVEVEDIPDGVGIFSDYPANVEEGAGEPSPGPAEPTVGLGEGSQGKTGAPDHPIPERILVPVGETMDEIGFSFNTGGESGLDPSDFPMDLTIQAVAESEY